jgi:decaprenylphospho-beta-D-erythro-pentofuranosid-2-ulose 2-reductase
MAIRSGEKVRALLNGLGEFQKIAVFGGKSDLALAILSRLPISDDSEIFLCGRNLSNFQIPDELSQFQVRPIDIDFRNVSEAKNIVSEVFQIGDIDLVILAFSILGDEDSQLQPDLFADVLFNNFFSQAVLLNQINAKMTEQKHGHILVFSSVAGIRPRKRNFVYGASKFGIDFIAQGLQRSNHKNNVHITILRPGFIHTKMTNGITPAPFAINQDLFSRIASRALARKKPIVYAPRILLPVMFLLKLLPEKIYRVIDK